MHVLTNADASEYRAFRDSIDLAACQFLLEYPFWELNDQVDSGAVHLLAFEGETPIAYARLSLPPQVGICQHLYRIPRPGVARPSLAEIDFVVIAPNYRGWHRSRPVLQALAQVAARLAQRKRVLAFVVAADRRIVRWLDGRSLVAVPLSGARARIPHALQVSIPEALNYPPHRISLESIRQLSQSDEEP